MEWADLVLFDAGARAELVARLPVPRCDDPMIFHLPLSDWVFLVMAVCLVVFMFGCLVPGMNRIEARVARQECESLSMCGGGI